MLVTKLPTRDVWKGPSRWRRGSVNFFTDGSKLEGKLGRIVFCDRESESELHRITNELSLGFTLAGPLDFACA